MILLTIFNGILGVLLKRFENDLNAHSEKFFRILNEVPTVLMIVIVFVVVLKPEF